MATKKDASVGTNKKVAHVNVIFRKNKISSVYTFSKNKEEGDSDYEDEDEDSSYTSVSSDEDCSDQEISEQDLMLYLLHRASIAAAVSKEKKLQNHKVRKHKKVTNERPVETPVNEFVTQKNADELVKEEEREKRKAERKKEKKKRRREKKRGKENIEFSDDNNIEENNREEIKQCPVQETKQNISEINDARNKKQSAVQTNNTLKKKQSVSETNNNPKEKRNASEMKDSLNKKYKSQKTNESSADDDELLDPSSAFVSVALSKNKKIQGSYNCLTEHIKTNKKSEQNSLFVKSEKLAMLGFDLASKEQYEEAIKYFTQAIQLVQDDPRFYGNRSFCYCQLGQYTKALKDADKAISLTPQNPKNHYRRGAALRGLKDYKRAQQSFEVVLQLDEGCEDAQQELEIIMVQQLTDMGFKEHEALAAIRKHRNVQAAIEDLTSIDNNNMTITHNGDNITILDEIYYSDEESEEEMETETLHNNIQAQSSSYISERIKNAHKELNKSTKKLEMLKMKHLETSRKSFTPNFTAPRFCKVEVVNPEGFLTLWIGNVPQETTEKQISDLFSMYGSINYVKLLPEKYCAFVNYKDKISSGMAMRALQGTELNGSRILIRYPTSHSLSQKTEKPTTSSSEKSTTSYTVKPTNVSSVKSTNVSSMKTNSSDAKITAASTRPKNTQPGEVEECHFWRTTGCLYGQKCRFRHVKENKGVDRKPWHRV